MEKRNAAVILIPLLMAVSGCSSTPSSQQTQQLHREIVTLNQHMSQLTLQAIALDRQNRLNQHSTQGAWLLPAAGAPVILQSEAGELRLSLTGVVQEAGGSRALLHVRSTDNAPVAALSGQIAWGEIDDGNGKPLTAASQRTTFQFTPSLLPGREATVLLRLNNYPPERLGYVRIHGLMPDITSPAVR